MLPPQHDYTVQALVPNRTHQSFGKRILPRTLACDLHFRDAHLLYSVVEFVSTNPVSVPEQIARRSVLRKDFHNLLCCPQRRWTFRDVGMDHAPTMMGQYHQDKQRANSGGRNSEEIDRHQIVDMVVAESLSRLRRRLTSLRQEPGHHTLRDFDPQLQKFPVDPWCSP